MSKRSERKAAAKERFPLPWIVALTIALAGFALGPTVGQHFVFRFGDQYRHAGLIAFLVLLPAIAIIRLLNSKGNNHPQLSAVFALINWVISTALIAAARARNTGYAWPITMRRIPPSVTRMSFSTSGNLPQDLALAS